MVPWGRESSGTIGVNAAAKKYAKYGITSPMIRHWVKNGEVAVAKAAAFPGDTVLLDEASLRKRISNYTPHRDNQSRRRRSQTIPEMQAEAQSNGTANGHHPQAGRAALSQPLPSTPAHPNGEAPVLIAWDWVARYYANQTRLHGEDDGTGVKALRPETKGSYDWVFDRFIERLPTVPLERDAVLAYIEGLTNLKKGGPLSGGSKMLVHRQLTAFYNWLHDWHQVETPNLTKHGIDDTRSQALSFRVEDIRALRKQVRCQEELTLILLLAQTGMRIGELCTVRPELVRGRYVEVWGKLTKASKIGWRQVPLPSECLEQLNLMFRTHGELVVASQRGVTPLAGPIERGDRNREIDLSEGLNLQFGKWPLTYRVRPPSITTTDCRITWQTVLVQLRISGHGKIASALCQVQFPRRNHLAS